jgi:sugar phosphate isomerase/epimerase
MTQRNADPYLVLCSATIFDRPLEDKIQAAAAGDFEGVTFWPHDYAGARARGLGASAIRRLLDDNGVAVDGVDCLLDWLPGDQVPDMPAFRATEDDLYAVVEAVGGARFINVAQAFGQTVDVAQATDLFAGICERAAHRKLLVTLEPVAWAGIGSHSVAKAIVEGSRAPNARIAFDAWGFFRGGSRIEDLQSTPGNMMDNVQLNDGPVRAWPDLFAEASDRLLPGDGELPVAETIAAMRASGYAGRWAIEAPSSRWKDLSAQEIGRQCGAAMRRSLAVQ